MATTLLPLLPLELPQTSSLPLLCVFAYLPIQRHPCSRLYSPQFLCLDHFVFHPYLISHCSFHTVFSSTACPCPFLVQSQILLVGDSGVGKSCLLNRFTSDKFDETTTSTIGELTLVMVAFSWIHPRLFIVCVAFLVEAHHRDYQS